MMSLTSCSSMLYRYQEVRDTNLVDVSYDAVGTLQDKLARPLPKNSLIIVSTLVNVDNSNQTSSFGRIISDQVASAFHDSGYQIIGIEMPIDLFVMQEDGKLHLSPETREMLKHYNATTIVGGVYAPGKKNTYVSLRLIDLNSRSFISSADFSVPMGPDAKILLQPKTLAAADKTAQATAPNPDSTTPTEIAPESPATEVAPEQEKSIDVTQ
ncbi:MAG: FlgO family outer membrane protein [Methylococcales bacterium]